VRLSWIYSLLNKNTFIATPLSRGADPVPASEVNIVGKMAGDATVLKKAKGASTIRLEKSK
jgi:hypothetical protein